MLSSEVISDPTFPAWVSMALVALGTVLGGGGIAAVMKARYDRKQGIESHEVTEDDAIASRWEALSRSQVELLLNPLKERLTEVEQTVRRLEAELDTSRKKYWTAIPYIRGLHRTLDRHAPDAARPTAPALIADDI